jgi:hypothetical protein
VCNCCIVESPSSFIVLCNRQIPCSLCVQVCYLSSCKLHATTQSPLLPPVHPSQKLHSFIVVPCASALLTISCTLPSSLLLPVHPSQKLHSSIIAPCASALFTNSCTQPSLHHLPVHSSPIPAPLCSHILCQCTPRQYLPLSIVASRTSALLAKSLFTAVLKSPAGTLLNYKSHYVTLLHTLS